jgi:hypothetical protein
MILRAGSRAVLHPAAYCRASHPGERVGQTFWPGSRPLLRTTSDPGSTLPPQASSMGKGAESRTSLLGSRRPRPATDADEVEPGKGQVLDPDLLWFVHGKAYDLNEFVARHPGKHLHAYGSGIMQAKDRGYESRYRVLSTSDSLHKMHRRVLSQGVNAWWVVCLVPGQVGRMPS